jgi:hypothetical protein
VGSTSLLFRCTLPSLVFWTLRLHGSLVDGSAFDVEDTLRIYPGPSVMFSHVRKCGWFNIILLLCLVKCFLSWFLTELTI